ncbi:MAG: nucleotide-binding universal stress UspA family protein [bacterium]|jgi:nucleotide-binding universal stress UspA family protein
MNDCPKMLLAPQAEPASTDLVDQASAWAERHGHTLHLTTVVEMRFDLAPIVGMDTLRIEQLSIQRKTDAWLNEMSERIPAAVRRTECSVMGLSKDAHSLPVDGSVNVRLPIDPWHANTGGTEWLAQHIPDADATAVHALTWLRIFGLSTEGGSHIYGAARDLLHSALEEEGHGKVPQLNLVREAVNGGAAIAHEAADVRADLIVPPTRRRSGILHAVMRSVAQRVV